MADRFSWKRAVSWSLYDFANSVFATTVGFSAANVFYDSLIVGVADEERVDIVSALGYSLGYLGGGLLFALNVFMVLKPGVFGFADPSQAVRVSFLTVSIWWVQWTPMSRPLDMISLYYR